MEKNRVALRLATVAELGEATAIIDGAKAFLKAQGIDQWQTGYPDRACIQRDIERECGYFVVDNGRILGYLCIDFDGEPAYDTLQGEWHTAGPYVVVHRMAFLAEARGKGLADIVFSLVEELSKQRGVRSFRVDTDADNLIMQRIFKKNDFAYCGRICFDNSEKIAFDKKINR